jgi:Mg/Co/Ni transporter MgtE
MANQHTDSIAKEPAQAEIETLLPQVVAHAPGEAVEMLAPYPNEFVAKMLTLLNPALAQDVLERFPSERRQKIVAAAPPETRQQGVRNEAFPESTIRRCYEGHHVASLSGLSGV